MDESFRKHLDRARALHRRVTVLDTHIDTTQLLADPDWDFGARHDFGHVDRPRLRDANVDAAFFAVWAPPSDEPGRYAQAARKQIEHIHRTIRLHSDRLTSARTAADIRQARANHRFAVLIAIEGGYLIEDSLDLLREYRHEGATYLTLTHAFHTTWADSAGVHEPLVPRHGGLTDFGREVVCELNRLAMMVDVSHVSDETFWDVVETSHAPIVATHSSCRAVSPHRRNLSDEMMQAIATSGGVVQINFAAAFIDPDHPPIDTHRAAEALRSGSFSQSNGTDHVTPLSVLVDHFDHALQTIGPDHVGIGSDFDGVPTLPANMEDCSKLANLTASLLERGYGEADLTKVLGENVLRVMETCERVAAKMEKQERTHEQVDQVDKPLTS